jgi:hypothetical protein
MTQQVRPAYRKPGFADGSDYAAMSIRTIRANLIKARWQASHRKQAGYTDAILSLSDPNRGLAKREETIYGKGLPTYAKIFFLSFMALYPHRDASVFDGRERYTHQ